MFPRPCRNIHSVDREGVGCTPELQFSGQTPGLRFLNANPIDATRATAANLLSALVAELATDLSHSGFATTN